MFFQINRYDTKNSKNSKAIQTFHEQVNKKLVNKLPMKSSNQDNKKVVQILTNLEIK